MTINRPQDNGYPHSPITTFTCAQFTFLQRNRIQHECVDEYNTVATLYCKPMSLASGAAAMCLPRHMGHWTARLPGLLVWHRAAGCLAGSHENGRQGGRGESQVYSHSGFVLSEHYRHTVSKTISVTNISASLKSTGSHFKGKLVFSVVF